MQKTNTNLNQSLHFFSSNHLVFFEVLISKIQSYYEKSLTSLAIFGSYARRENRLNSDLDLLIILQDSILSRGKRIEEFVREIESKVEEERESSYREGIYVEISPLIFTQNEADVFNPLYLDMVDHHFIIVDKEDYLKHRLQKVRQQMIRWGSRKQEVGGHWYWEIKPGLKSGEVIDYDE